jgi:hypothetical protein
VTTACCAKSTASSIRRIAFLVLGWLSQIGRMTLCKVDLIRTQSPPYRFSAYSQPVDIGSSAASVLYPPNLRDVPPLHVGFGRQRAASGFLPVTS